MSTREETFRIVVLISADAEWAPTKEALQPADVERTPYGESFTHDIAGERIVFLNGGWGKIAAAASTEYAISRWRPAVLVNLGTCGGIAGRVECGAKLLVTRAITYDIYEGIDPNLDAVAAYTTDIDVSWFAGPLPAGISRASIVSADRDLVPEQIGDLVQRYDAIAGDWESSAIAYVAARRQTPLLIIRGVSDLVSPAGGEAIGALPLYRERAAATMRSLLDDLAALVPSLLRRH